MRLLAKIPFVILVAINLLVIVAMNLCVYTSYIPAQMCPQLSYWGMLFPIFLLANAVFIPVWLVFKWKMAALPLLGMLLCAGGVRTYIPVNLRTEPPQGSIKVLSYNVMGFGKVKGVAWQDNAILNSLLESGADVICLQEAMHEDVDGAVAVLNEIYPYNALEITPKNYMACFSKFPIRPIQRIDYPSETNCSYAYELDVDGDTVMLINNHFESYKLNEEDKADYKSIIKNYSSPDENNSEAKFWNLMEKVAYRDSIRGIQADSVAAFIERSGRRHVIACGDFNAPSISYTHCRMTRYLNDAYTRSGNGLGISYNRSGMYFRIDNILISPNMTAYGAKVDKSISDSDHYPIYCFVNLEGK